MIYWRKWFSDPTQLAIGFLMVVYAIVKLVVIGNKELSWDVFGYYLHLPAYFIYGQHSLNDTSWIYDILDKYHLTETLYQLSSAPDGSPIFFFLMGMSFFYVPWFFLGHIIATLTSFPADGFSMPYQLSLGFGMLVYTLAGLLYLRKWLLLFFSKHLTTLLILLIGLATNYFQFATVKNLETTNVLFMLTAMVAWYSHQWYLKGKHRYAIILGITITLITLVKPSEILVALIPLLWGIVDRESLYQRFRFLSKHKTGIILAIAAATLLALPQMLYWYRETGYLLYDSYKNPGVGLDLSSPYIMQVLFSYRKGWLVYTPVMIMSIVGFFVLYRRNRPVFYPLLVYSLFSFYIISSWTEWWYGGSFGNRPMITLYPVLAVPLGYLLHWLGEKGLSAKLATAAFLLSCTLLNLFQIWQLNQHILDPYRTNKAYYWAIFGRTKATEEQRMLLDISHFESESNRLHNEAAYQRRNIGYYTFDEPLYANASKYIITPDERSVFQLDSMQMYSPEIKTSFTGLTQKDHAWVRASVDILVPSDSNDLLPLLILTFEREEGAYHYRAYGIDTNRFKPGEWARIEADYLTPQVRNRNDIFKCYVWHRSKQTVWIDNLKADVFDPH